MNNQAHLLAGPSSHKMPMHNMLALQRGEYDMVGVMIALSITQGGPAPAFFASVVGYLFGGVNSVNIGDIPDIDVQQ